MLHSGLVFNLCILTNVIIGFELVFIGPEVMTFLLICKDLKVNMQITMIDTIVLTTAAVLRSQFSLAA